MADAGDLASARIDLQTHPSRSLAKPGKAALSAAGKQAIRRSLDFPAGHR